MSMVSWFHRFPGVNGFVCLVASMDTWFRRFRGVNCFMVSCVSWFHRFCGLLFHGFIGFVVSMVSWC